MTVMVVLVAGIDCDIWAGAGVPARFSPDRRSVDIAAAVDGEGGNFLLGGAVQHEALAGGRNAIDQAAAVRTGDQIPLGIESQDANMSFIALEKQRRLAVARHPENFSPVPGGDVELAFESSARSQMYLVSGSNSTVAL